MIPAVLSEMQNFLIKNKITLEIRHADGRLNSAENESQILGALRAEFKIREPEAREWYDFIAIDKDEKYPVNIKVTTLETTDNLQCKLGIYYAVTGNWPDFSNSIAWDSFFKRVSSDVNSTKTGDYFFLVVSKSDPSDIIVTSLKQIGILVPNGNNLPFQCHWGRNRILINRSHDEAVKFILGVLGKSCELRANIKSEFEKYLSNYT